MACVAGLVLEIFVMDAHMVGGTAAPVPHQGVKAVKDVLYVGTREVAFAAGFLHLAFVDFQRVMEEDMGESGGALRTHDFCARGE